MAPKKAPAKSAAASAKAAGPPAGQPTIGAAFARKSGEGVAAAAGGAASPGAAAPPPLVLVRQLGGVVEYSDFAVNNIKDEAGAKPSAYALEADVVDSGACPSPRHAARCDRAARATTHSLRVGDGVLAGSVALEGARGMRGPEAATG